MMRDCHGAGRSDRDRLAKIMGLLGSEYPGEQVSAATKSWTFLRERGLTWFDPSVRRHRCARIASEQHTSVDTSMSCERS
jgi:hypothetical protein